MKELCKRSLADFIVHAWHVVEPEAALVWNWHMQVVADFVQSNITGVILPTIAVAFPGATLQNILINIPPGTSKSLIHSVFAPAWMWLTRPGWKATYASGNENVTVRDSMKCRDLIQSDWYQNTFEPDWHFAADQNAKTIYRNTAGGFRRAVSVGQDITGDRSDHLGIDDPIDAADAPSKLKRDTCNYWYDRAWHNRVNSSTKSTRSLIMQRLNEEDLSGHVMPFTGRGHYEVLCLPMEYESNHPHKSALDPRKVDGELLFEERFPKDVLEEMREIFGTAGYAGQMQQRPMPEGGGIFRISWFRFYKTHEIDPPIQWRPNGANQMPAALIPSDFDWTATSWDASFKEAKDTDFVAGGLWAGKGANRYMVDRFHKRTGFIGMVEAVIAMSTKKVGERKRGLRKHLIEDKANGSAVVEVLKDRIAGIEAVNPEGGKEARAAAVSPLIEAGHVFLPDGAPWLQEFFDEVEAFPHGSHDDEVDQMTQLLLHYSDSQLSFAVRFAARLHSNPLSLMGRAKDRKNPLTGGARVL